MERFDAQCCIVGGGPAGLMAGLLLAHAGCHVVVLEKHGDFLRDFRGDTIHPSTLEIMHELGLLKRLLELPHEKVSRLSGQFGGESLPFADFSHLPVHAPFIAMMPQWDFLNFLAEEARHYPGFALHMETEATGLIEENGRTIGVRAASPAGSREFRARLTIAADGRHSILRAEAGLEVQNLGAPIDVLWFRLSRQPGDTAETIGRFEPGAIIVTINRGDHWQCAFVIPKGGIERVKAEGLPAFRARLARVLPFGPARAEEIDSWEKVKLLTVAVDRLTTWWRLGLLCIGDAAHAMSPVGGVGINLAVQDAVAPANLLAAPIREDRVRPDDLARVQRRRMLPTRVIPLPVRLLARWPFLRRLPARLVGLGIRPEHVAKEIRTAMARR